MNFRRITPFIILMFFIALLFQVGCDTLVTENNTVILFDSSLAVGCFDCHSDDDNMLLRPRGQFDNSAHADHSLLDVVDVACTKCHTHEGFLNTYTAETIDHSAFSVINCFTCHQPHPEAPGTYGEWDMKDLRAGDTNVRFVETQLTGRNDGSGYGTDFGLSNSCGHCHKATAAVDKMSQVTLTEDFGPHVSPQADIVSARSGYFYDIASVEPIKLSAHFDNGCIKCHYGKFGEGQGYTFGEHTFRLEDKISGQQFVDNCNGCHTGNPAIVTAFYDRPSVIEMNNLADSIKSLLASYKVIDLSSDESGLTYEIGKTVSEIKAQAYYNLQMFIKDGSQGIHNPNFITAMLDSTINVLDSLPAEINFSTDVTEGCDSLDVTFTPEILGAFDSLFLSFGDGIVDTVFDNSPINHTYNSIGLYPVRLTAISMWNADSLSIIIDTVPNADTTLPDTVIIDSTFPGYLSSSVSDTLIINYITVDTDPVASFTIDTDTMICKGDAVTFTSTSDHLLTPILWEWTITDTLFAPNDTTVLDSTHIVIIVIDPLETDTTEFTTFYLAGDVLAVTDTTLISTIADTVSFAFSRVGQYSVMLSVNTVCGIDDTLISNYITVNNLPTANFSFASNAAPDTLTYNFTDLSTDAVAWSWEFFEDGTSVGTAAEQNPTYTYSDTVTLGASAELTVTNPNGCTRSITKLIF